MIYDHNLEKQRIATCEEKIFFEAALMSIWDYPEDIDIDNIENNISHAGDYPVVDMMSDKQKISIYADFLRKLLDDNCENICNSIWADSIIISLIESFVQAIFEEQDGAATLSPDSENAKELFIHYHFYRMVAVHYCDVKLNYKLADNDPWREAIYDYADEHGFINQAYICDLINAATVDCSGLEPPPSDWVGKWHFDANWLAHHSKLFQRDTIIAFKSDFLPRIKLPKKFQ